MCMKNDNKKVNREMCNLAHYKFKERLKYKALLNNCQVIDCCESYTSKTCTKCGELNNVGSKKEYKCDNCSCHIDRDLNGARNIFIRCLTKYYS
jgi:putative transposase